MIEAEPAPASSATAAAKATARSKLRELAVRASVIELVGHVGNQGMRLLNNLILSRLLFPEAYGLTAIVSVYMYGILMLSDVGIRHCVMRSPRGDDPSFLNTAWSVHIIRGGLLFVVSCALAWPLSMLYGKPVLGPLLAVSALATLIEGFESTATMTLARRVQRAPLVVLELITKVASTILMIVWAVLSPSVWALVAGGTAAVAFYTAGSHFLQPRRKHRFQIEPEAAKELRGFGKWVFGSSAFTFASQEADRLFLGYLLDLTTLGVYSIAGLLSSAISAVTQRMTHSVVYGMLTATVRERPEELGAVYYSARLRLDLLTQPVLGGAVVFGPTLVAILYDDRYLDAGWMLQVLCVRVAISCVSMPASMCLVARGEPRQTMIGQVARFCTVWIGMPVGWHFFGLEGALWSSVISEVALLVALWVSFIRRGLLRPLRELIAPATFGVGMLAGLALHVVATPWFQALILYVRHLRQ